MRTAVLLFLAHVIALAGAPVTSQEQFKRFLRDRSPNTLTNNFDRAYAEVPPSENCPVGARAFFSLHISKEGNVETAKGHLVAFSSDLRSVALRWARGLLKEIHFRPLMYGNKSASVDMSLTLVCGG